MINIGVLSEVSVINQSVLQVVLAEINKSLKDDFAPIWAIDAQCEYFTKITDIPKGYFPVTIKHQISVNTLDGWHGLDEQGNPYGEVKFTNDWTYSLDHEIKEIAHNPYLKKYRKSTAIIENEDENPLYVEEIADATDKVGYTRNSVRLSNFITPNWFDIYDNEYYAKLGLRFAPVKYDFLGILKKTRELYENGSISWLTVRNEYWQAQKVKGKLIVRNLTKGTVLENTNNQDTLINIGLGFLAGLTLYILYRIFK